MNKYWERQTAGTSGTGELPVEPGTSTSGLMQLVPPETGTDSLLRLIITSRLTIVPDATSPLLDPGWMGRCEARVVAALQEPAATWPNYFDINNVNILGRTTMNVTPLGANSSALNGAAVYQTVSDIDLKGMRDFSVYPITPVLRLGGNFASLDLGGLTGNTYSYAWFSTVSVLWGVSG